MSRTYMDRQTDTDRQRDKDTAEIKQCWRENKRKVLCRRRQEAFELEVFHPEVFVK